LSKECPFCREDNADSAVKCENCEAVLSGNKITGNSGETGVRAGESGALGEKAGAPVLQMSDLKTGKVINIKENCIIGRSGNAEPEYFAGNMYVSEYHCKVVLENNQFKIEHLPTAKNPTKLNGEPLSKGIHMVLRDGDYLKIADMMFEISQKETSIENKSDLEIVKNVKYIIKCPKCACEYEVADVNERITECKNCDEYDLHEISRVKAKVKYAN